MRIVWSKQAVLQLEKAYQDIALDSIQAAAKVKDDLLEKIAGLLDFPERYPLDKYRKDNSGKVRAFEKHRYRVAYQVENDHIRILRIIHTSRLPLDY
jgi:plasmid stabilization system protein ParE